MSLAATTSGAALKSLVFMSVGAASCVVTGILFFFFFFFAAGTNQHNQHEAWKMPYSHDKRYFLKHTVFFTTAFYRIIQWLTFRFWWHCAISSVEFWFPILLRFGSQGGHVGSCWCCNNQIPLLLLLSLQLLLKMYWLKSCYHKDAAGSLYTAALMNTSLMLMSVLMLRHQIINIKS